MAKSIKKTTQNGDHPISERARIEEAIRNSNYSTLRVVGRGTLTVDPKEVSDTTEFKKYAEKAKRIVRQAIRGKAPEAKSA